MTTMFIKSSLLAPVQTTFTISEGNETIVQENSFQNNTGILGNIIYFVSLGQNSHISELIVPPHKNYTETVFMLHQESVCFIHIQLLY